MGESPSLGRFIGGNLPPWDVSLGEMGESPSLGRQKIVGVVLVVVIWNGMWEKVRHLLR